MLKSRLNLFLLTTILLIGFSACHKHDSTEDKVDGKWFVEKRKITTTRNGQGSINDYPVTSADYFSFRKKTNSFIRSFDGVVTSGTYLVISDNLIKINNDTATISLITKDQFNFTIRAVGIDAVMETELNLTK